ncbi:TadE/TadG family type IV pilus assembly protein [Streptomyces sp. NPDC086023]|uniref:TadE/TadG family type IV pilus assembly protein n=1 Tax=Streptomyces sp. NPDC086023 TaxID=3365746 RepID=UPI0037D67802
MRRGNGCDRGQVLIEYAGFLPLLLLVAVAGLQIGYVAYAYEQAGTAARAAARYQALHGTNGAAAGRAAINDGLAEHSTITVDSSGDRVRAEARLRITSIVPGLSFDDAVRTATMPKDAE